MNYFTDQTSTPIPAVPSIVENRCVTNGYINWLRLVGVGAVLIQGLAAYLSYRYCGLDKDTGRGDYTQVDDGPTFFNAKPKTTSPSASTAPTSTSPSLAFSSPYQDGGYQTGGHDDNLM